MNLHKILRIVALILALAGIIFAVMLAGGNEGQIGGMLTVAYVVLAIVVLLVLLFTLKNMFSNSATLMSTLKGLGAFVLVALICYFGFAEGVETPLRDEKVLSEGGSKLVGTGLYMFYALVIIACGTMLFSGIKKMIDK